MPSMDSLASGGVESSAESPAPAAEAEEEAVPKSSPAAAATKGLGLHRWRRIRRDQLREGYAAAAAAGSGVGDGGDEDSAQLHKRRLLLPSDAPKGKHEAALVEVESSTASVESRFVPLQPSPPVKLDPGLGLLIASAGFSVGEGGADSDNSEEVLHRR